MPRREYTKACKKCGTFFKTTRKGDRLCKKHEVKKKGGGSVS